MWRNLIKKYFNIELLNFNYKIRRNELVYDSLKNYLKQIVIIRNFFGFFWSINYKFINICFGCSLKARNYTNYFLELFYKYIQILNFKILYYLFSFFICLLYFFDSINCFLEKYLLIIIYIEYKLFGCLYRWILVSCLKFLCFFSVNIIIKVF